MISSTAGRGKLDFHVYLFMYLFILAGCCSETPALSIIQVNIDMFPILRCELKRKICQERSDLNHDLFYLVTTLPHFGTRSPLIQANQI